MRSVPSSYHNWNRAQLPADQSWDIFCRVIDNFGDAGVCWRLATELARRGERVTLFIDDPATLQKLADPDTTSVSVKLWPESSEAFAGADIPDVVIEAFACDLPDVYVAAMAKRAESGKPPVWINLEYLSAEDWVITCHRQPSPHPRFPLIKHFYFPGFTEGSGGLLREPGIISQPNAQDPCNASGPSQSLRILLFCYEQPALNAWLQALGQAGNTILSIAPCPAIGQLTDSRFIQSDKLIINFLPFVPQSAFDSMLVAHDLLFVRGEDSFVRAQWSGKPLFWHIYPQDEGAHLEKLRAFYKHYLDPAILTADQRATVQHFLLSWNGGTPPGDCDVLWPQILQMLPALRKNALVWREKLLKQPDLVTQLQAFIANLVK